MWSLYFAILDAAAKMSAEEGKKVWGAAEWRKIVARVRSGAVWDEAIVAYGGEGRIDGDVINALYVAVLSPFSLSLFLLGSLCGCRKILINWLE